jgi:solute carrier family 45 protein 1/2/4
LVVDVLPTGLQPAGNAWAATMLGVGGVFGFFVFVPINTALVSPAKQ